MLGSDLGQAAEVTNVLEQICPLGSTSILQSLPELSSPGPGLPLHRGSSPYNPHILVRALSLLVSFYFSLPCPLSVTGFKIA